MIAGATYTSEAVLKAVNKAFEFLRPGATAPADNAAPTEQPVPSGAQGTGEMIKASSVGFQGPVAVTIQFDDQGAITFLAVGDDEFAETPAYGAKAKEESFTAQFIGKTPPLALADIDALSGATVTSKAVVDAVNKAYSERNALETGAPGASVSAEPEAAATAATVAATQGPAPEGAQPLYTASSEGYGGPVAVTVRFDAAGAIASLTVGDESFAETPGLGAKAKEEAFTAQFIGKTPPLGLGDIDAIASATVTSEAVLSAVNKAWEELTGK